MTKMPIRDRPSSTSGGERGSASIELVVLLPALFTLLFLGLQGALYFYAQSVATAAAAEGARTAAALNATSSLGAAAASDFAADVGTRALREVSVDAARDQTTATVTVSGASVSVIPLWQPVIQRTVTVPVERLTAP
ncbi:MULTISPECIES: TadE family protein [unclassified Isoptericola]|uniref:TadE family protein n=1 Tax=unclassified Isoptericola TaxID=2623355 RepID=UPI003659A8FC